MHGLCSGSPWIGRVRSSQSCERREKSGRGAERVIGFGLDYGGCFLELEALTMNINGTEFNQESGVGCSNRDSAEVRTGAQKGKWLAWRYKSIMGNGNELHYKNRIEQLSLETLDSEERKGSGGPFSKVVQVTVRNGTRGIYPQGRMQENHEGSATVTSKRSHEGANQGAEMPGDLTAAACGIPSPSPPSWVLRILGRKWPAVKGMCEEAPSAHPQAGWTCLQLLLPLSCESKLPTWSLLLDLPAPHFCPCQPPFFPTFLCFLDKFL